MGNYRRCEVAGCPHTQGVHRGTFFKFPSKDDQRHQRWIDFAKREPKICPASGLNLLPDTKRAVVCISHFDDSCFINPITRKQLMSDAIPSLHDKTDPPPPWENRMKAVVSELPRSTIYMDEGDPAEALLGPVGSLASGSVDSTLFFEPMQISENADSAFCGLTSDPNLSVPSTTDSLLPGSEDVVFRNGLPVSSSESPVTGIPHRPPLLLHHGTAKCFVPSCVSGKLSDQAANIDVFLHAFPGREKPLYKIWVDFCRQRDPVDSTKLLEPGKTDGVCSAHFDDSCFKVTSANTRLLKPDAVPTVRVPRKSAVVQVDEFLHTRPLPLAPVIPVVGPVNAKVTSKVKVTAAERHTSYAAPNRPIYSLEDIIQYLPVLPKDYTSYSIPDPDGPPVFCIGKWNPTRSSPSNWFSKCIYFENNTTPKLEFAGEPHLKPQPPIRSEQDLKDLIVTFGETVICSGLDKASFNGKYSEKDHGDRLIPVSCPLDRTKQSVRSFVCERIGTGKSAVCGACRDCGGVIKTRIKRQSAAEAKDNRTVELTDPGVLSRAPGIMGRPQLMHKRIVEMDQASSNFFVALIGTPPRVREILREMADMASVDPTHAPEAGPFSERYMRLALEILRFGDDEYKELVPHFPLPSKSQLLIAEAEWNDPLVHETIQSVIQRVRMEIVDTPDANNQPAMDQDAPEGQC